MIETVSAPLTEVGPLVGLRVPPARLRPSEVIALLPESQHTRGRSLGYVRRGYFTYCYTGWIAHHLGVDLGESTIEAYFQQQERTFLDAITANLDTLKFSQLAAELAIDLPTAAREMAALADCPLACALDTMEHLAIGHFKVLPLDTAVPSAFRFPRNASVLPRAALHLVYGMTHDQVQSLVSLNDKYGPRFEERQTAAITYLEGIAQ